MFSVPPAFDCTTEENDGALRTLRRRAWLALRAKINEHTSDASFLAKLRTNFEERFRYDDKGVPRVWTPDDDIDSAFRKARDDVRLLLAATCCLLIRLLTLPHTDPATHPALLKDLSTRLFIRIYPPLRDL